jgi:PAS domain S-box-containing protein
MNAPWLSATEPATDRWLTGMLDLMQEFGRMAVFQRNLRTGEGRWSRQMFRLYGLEPTAEVPTTEAVMRTLHPDDRERSSAEFAAAARAAGRYETRFRIVRANGDVHHIHGLCEVRSGSDGKPELMVGVLIDDTEAIQRMQLHEELNAQLSQAVSLASVSIWRVDLATQRVDYNDYGYRVTGFARRPGGVPLAEVRAMVHPDDREAIVQAAEEAMHSSRVVDVEARYRNPDGSYRHLLTRRVAERDASGRVVALAGVSIDQTQRIQERERARTLAHRIDIITRAAGVGVWSIDIATDEMEWNEQTYRIYGLPLGTPAPSIKEMVERFVHPDDRAMVLQQRRRAAQFDHVGIQFQFRILRPTGELRWLSTWSRREHAPDGRLMAYGVTMDVTERVLAEAKLRELDERALLAAESAGIGTWERDCSTGETRWDAQMYRLRGLTPDCGMTPEETRQATNHPEDRTLLDAKYLHATQTGDDYEHEFRVIWPDGTVRWLATRGVARRDAAGKLERIAGVNWDITERKRAEQALRDKAAAEQANRAKSEFLSRMSHELRTPLNAVLGFAQLLMHDVQEGLSPRQGERMQHIHSAGLHLMALIDDVLDLASIESSTLKLDVQPVSLQAAFDDVLQWTHSHAQRAAVRIHVAPTPGWVRADARRLRQILANLLSNAIKYNRPQGEVWLHAQPVALHGGEGWELRVRDTGRGMSLEQQAHLFEPFNRLGAEREGIEGTGIGLAIVRHLVDLMGGRIQVHSEPGRGSQFCVGLAATPAQSTTLPQPRPPAPAPAADGADHALTVLYVEDNPVNVLLVEQLMALRPTMRLLTAGDGAGGVAMACSCAPDLVLIDMQLPDFDGFEVLRRLRGEPGLNGGTFIALSASAMPEEVRRAKEAGFSDYWTKPIDFVQFLGGLDSLAALRQARRLGA